MMSKERTRRFSGLWQVIGALSLMAMPHFALAENELVSELAPANSVSGKPKLALQLWSIRQDVRQDFEGSLRAVAAMGFAGVEFAGDFGSYKKRPEDLKRLLDDLGLKVASAHVSLAQLNEQEFDATVAFFRLLDCPSLIIPSDPRAFHEEGVLQLAQDLKNLSQRLKPYGMRIGFHNHSEEMRYTKAYPGMTFWDVIAQNTPPEVVLQQDVGWTSYADRDPVLYMQRYPQRTLSTHFKSKLRDKTTPAFRPLIGQDGISWPDLLEAASSVGGTQWIIVEQEDFPDGMSPMQSVKASLQGLHSILQKTNTTHRKNEVSLAEKSRGWRSLFDGNSDQGWHRYGGGKPGRAWRFDQGEISLHRGKTVIQKEGWQSADGGDIVTDAEFSNFHLQLEWKISVGGNSGIFIFVNEQAQQFPYPWQTGLEMQILDDAVHPDGQLFRHRAGDLYDLQTASLQVAREPGQWNQVDIVCIEGSLDFFLNGQHILYRRLWDEAWWSSIAQSKFASMPGFGRSRKGRIGLQDHGDGVSFRNVRIREITP